jgi:hypothetical protein
MSWKYINEGNIVIIDEKNSSILENEYNSFLNGSRMGLEVFHCFGNGQSAIVDYKNMVTECGTGKCRSCSDKHMSYRLIRD